MTRMGATQRRVYEQIKRQPDTWFGTADFAGLVGFDKARAAMYRLFKRGLLVRRWDMEGKFVYQLKEREQE